MASANTMSTSTSDTKTEPQIQEEAFPKSVTQSDFAILPPEGYDFERYPVNNVFTSEKKFEEGHCYEKEANGIYANANEKTFNFSHWSTYHPQRAGTPKSVCHVDYNKLPEDSYQFTRHYNMKDPSLIPFNATFRGTEYQG